MTIVRLAVTGATSTGIVNDGSLVLARGAFATTRASTTAGGVLDNGSLTVASSAIVRNVGEDRAGLRNVGAATIVDSTISDNSSGLSRPGSPTWIQAD